MTDDRELKILRLLREMDAYLEEVRDEEKALRYFLRAARERLRASQAAIAVAAPPPEDARILFDIPRGAAWDLRLIGAFLAEERPSIPFNTLAAPLRRRGRRFGAIVLRKDAGQFERGEGWTLVELTAHAGTLLDRLDVSRVQEVRARIDRKIMEQIRPRDLFYQILDALRALTHYDHSSALMIASGEGRVLELAAEQLAWRKGGSQRIGLKRPLEQPLAATLRAGKIQAFTRGPSGWTAWDPSAEAALARLLEFDGGTRPSGDEPPKAEILCAPIVTRRGVIGLLTVASRAGGAFGEFELGVLGQFASHASVAIQYLQETETLETRMIEAERKHAIASIARGVAHDVNNALGSVLPLVQQMQEEARAGTLDPAAAVADLAQVEVAVQYCRKIFRNMMSFGSVSGGKIGVANVRRAVEGTLAILRSALERSRVRVEVDVASDLPQASGGQGDLERLIFNICTNALDAMPRGGVLRLEARSEDGHVALVIRDTGFGMSRETLARIFEPGFTTKENGTGLGLSVCRAIVWSAGGDMRVESVEERGTVVRAVLPAAGSGGGGE